MAGNIFHTILARFAVAMVNFAILILSSRYLGVASRGEISIFLLNLSLVQAVSEIYTGYSIVHFVPQFSMKRILANGLAFALGACVVINAILWGSGRGIVDLLSSIAVSGLVVCNTFFCILLLGRERIRAFNRLSLVQPSLLLAALVAWIFALRVFTFDAYFFPLVISFAVTAPLSLLVLSPFISDSQPVAPFLPAIEKGIYFQSAVLMQVFANRFSFYVLPDARSVGLYANACVLMESVLLVAYSITPVLLSRIANMPAPHEAARLALSMARLALFTCLIAGGIILLVPESVFLLVLGHGFAGVKPLMTAYAPAVLCVSFTVVLSQFFFATGKSLTVLLCYTAGFAHTLLRSHRLIEKHGITGAALNADISYVVMCASLLTVFVVTNRLTLSEIFGVRGDLARLKKIFAAPGAAKPPAAGI